MIGIIDYGIGNVSSVNNILCRFTKDILITNNPNDLKRCSKIVLPGIGNFDGIMRRLDDLGLRNPLKRNILIDKKPTLAICAGLQILVENSEEGTLTGLGVLKGGCKRICHPLKKTPVPNISWAEIQYSSDQPCHFMPTGPFYFAHSYSIEKSNILPVWGTFSYFQKDYVASIKTENIWGVQFHPEKSNLAGLNFISAFERL